MRYCNIDWSQGQDCRNAVDLFSVHAATGKGAPAATAAAALPRPAPDPACLLPLPSLLLLLPACYPCPPCC